MRPLTSVLLLIAGIGCAARSASALSDPPRALATPASAAVDAGSTSSPEAQPAPAVAAAAESAAVAQPEAAPDAGASLAGASAADDDSDGDDEGGKDDDSGDVGESHDVAPVEGEVVNRYTADIADEELARRWKEDPASLGSISFGFTDEGRLVNGVAFPEGKDWIVVSPGYTYGTKETVEFIEAAIRRVKEQFPEAPPLRVNQISARDGGYLRPHKSHQNGRDADLAFYYPTAEPVRARQREKYIDVPKTWALLKALVTLGDVQMVLVDRHVQQVLYDYALGAGEDKAWLDSLFRSEHPLVQHARHHRDHFHVRFFSARAQELGRRLSPLLALRPDQNILMHRVHRGDTLGHIALRYGSSVAALQKANHIRGHLLRVSQVLMVPLRGPCTKCPIPAPVIVPPRHLPPVPAMASAKPAAPEVATPTAAAGAPSAASTSGAASVTSPAVGASGTSPGVGASGTSSAAGASVTSPAVGASGTSPAVSASGTSPAVSASGTSPVVSASGTSPAMSASGTSPAVSASGTSPAVSASGTSPAVSASGTSPAAPEPAKSELAGGAAPAPVPEVATQPTHLALPAGADVPAKADPAAPTSAAPPAAVGAPQ